MTTTWLAGISGNWNNPAYWSGGVPNAAEDAFIDASGTYTVTLSSAATASSLMLNAAGATLDQLASGGPLTLFALNLDAGTVILRRANTIDQITMSGGRLETGNANGLGTSDVTMHGGALIGLANVTLANPFAIDGDATIASVHGKVLDFGSGGWSIDESSIPTVTFGDAANDGTVRLSGSYTTIVAAHYDVDVRAGTLQEGGDGTLSQVLGDAGNVIVEAGATIDWNGEGGQISQLSGSGTITNTGALETLRVSATTGDGFDGDITGALNLDITSGIFVLNGQASYTGVTSIYVGATLELHSALTSPVVNDSLLKIVRNVNTTITKLISATGAVLYDMNGHTVTINRPMTYQDGTALVNNTTLSIDRGSAIGTGPLSMQGATVLATDDVKLLNQLDLQQGDSYTFAAATGKTLELKSPIGWSLSLTGDPVLRFGDGTHDGTVLWHQDAGFVLTGSGSFTIDVRSGILKPGGTVALTFLTTWAIDTVVEAGATIDIGGKATTIANLSGAGTVTNSEAKKTLIVQGGHFNGAITGTIHLEVDGALVLGGANTYIGNTAVEAGAVLSLGGGGGGGSVVGTIVNDGTLIFDHNNVFAVSNAITGSGNVVQLGTGTTSINRAESYSGGTTIGRGILAIDRGSALGTGDILFTGGELVATDSLTLSNALHIQGNTTIAAAHGKTLNIGGVGWILEPGEGLKVVFGQGARDGVVVWHTASHTITDSDYVVDVREGTLKAGDNALSELLSGGQQTTVEAGAKLNIATHNIEVHNLHGAGKIFGNGGILTIQDGNFAGALNGHMAVIVTGDVTLSGGGTINGAVAVHSGATLTVNNAAHEALAINDGTLVLNDPDLFDGTIFDFNSIDIIDLPEVGFAGVDIHWNQSTHTLTVENGTDSVHLHLDGSYTVGDFGASNDGNGGTDIFFIV